MLLKQLPRRLWDSLTEPFHSVVGVERRRASRQLAGTLFWFVVLGLAATSVNMVLTQAYLSTYVAAAIMLTAIAIAWFLARLGRYETAVALSIFAIVVGSIGLVLVNPKEVGAFFYSILAVVLAAMFLSGRQILATAVVIIGGMTAVLVVYPERAPRGDVALVPMFLLILSFAIWLTRRYRDEIEAIRQHQLRVSEERYQLAVDAAKEGVWEYDLATQQIHLSPQALAMLGFAEGETSSEPNAWAERIHPDDVASMRTTMKDFVEGRIPEFEAVYRIQNKQGEMLWLKSSAALVKNNLGKPVKVIGSFKDITDIKNAEAALLAERNFANAVVESANSLVVVLDHKGHIVRFNQACEDVTGYSAEEALGRLVWDFLLIPEERDSVKQVFESLTTEALASHFQNYWLNKDGSRHLVDWSNSVISDPSGNVLYIVSIGSDITEKQKAEADMVKHAHALEQTADSVIITDKRGIIEYVNPAFEAATGFSRAEAIGNTPRIVKSGQHDVFFYEKLWKTILGGGVFREVFVNRAKDGHIYYEEKTITPLLDSDGEITHFVSSGKDITERMETQERLYYLAHHDALTELPNRVMFLDRLKHVATRLLRRDQICAVLFLDLDRFKNINDTLGHDTGDKLLQAVGDRLKESVRAGDTVARLGGDEFTVLLEDIESPDDIAPIARKILKSLTAPFHVDDHELFTSASIGISLCPSDGTDPNSLLKNADTAMYRAKEQGRNNFQFYSAEMGARALEHLTMETGLRHALERNEFELYYQPQFRMNDNAVIGAEVLLRWRHPSLGLISPNEFIPLLEDTGLVVSVGYWVVREVCRHLNAWRAEGRSIRRVSINLSARQFDELDFLDSVLEIIRQEKVNPSAFEFEITESLLLKRAQYTVDVLEQFSSEGISIALDDFGTGYSSLSYLKRYPINTIKIDRSFVRDIPDDQEDSEIVKAILAMARSLHIDVIAEGVETVVQERFLRDAGCEMLQGYLHGKPLPVSDFAENFLAVGKDSVVSS